MTHRQKPLRCNSVVPYARQIDFIANVSFRRRFALERQGEKELSDVLKEIGVAVLGALGIYAAIEAGRRWVEPRYVQERWTLDKYRGLQPRDLVLKFVRILDEHCQRCARLGVSEKARTTKLSPNLISIANHRAGQWARSHALQLADDIDETTIRWVRDQIGRWHEAGNESVEDLAQTLTGPFSPQRARRIAVTETTRSHFEGSMEVYRNAPGVAGVLWMTQYDERVCPICGPMHEVPGPLTGVWPNGLSQPAHVNCRCYTLPLTEEGVKHYGRKYPYAYDYVR